MKTKRIDQYLCIDTDQIIIDEMKDIIDNGCGSKMKEDKDAWERYQEAAKVILGFYTV